MTIDEKLPPGHVFRMEVVGEAAPGGSKTARPIFKDGKPMMKGGKPVIAMRPASKKTRPWMNLVAETAVHAWGPRDTWVLDGPVIARVTFYVPRPATHYSARPGPAGERVLKPSAPVFPSTPGPDLDKAARSTLDALKGIVFTNDRRIVDLHARREWGGSHYCVIEIERPVYEKVGDSPPITPFTTAQIEEIGSQERLPV